MDQNTTKNNPKYFYAVVLITVAIVSFMVWEIFITDYDYDESMLDNSLQSFPNIDLVFLDSYFFQNLSVFNRGDSPLLPWSQLMIENPFRTPRIPADSQIKKWWENFNFIFEIDDGWKGIYPAMISEEINPDIFLFEERWYKVNIENFSEQTHDFRIENNAGEILVDSGTIKPNSDKEFEFQAKSGMVSYFSSSDGMMYGNIIVMESDDYDAALKEDEDQKEEEEAQKILIQAGEKLTEFYNTLENAEEFLEEEDQNDLEMVYSEFESQFREIEENHNQGELEISSLEQAVNQYIADIEIEINRIEELITPSTEAEGEFTEIENILGSFSEKIEQIEDPEKLEEAESAYGSFEDELKNIKDRYEADELTSSELAEEINQFSLRVEQKIEDLGFIN